MTKGQVHFSIAWFDELTEISLKEGKHIDDIDEIFGTPQIYTITYKDGSKQYGNPQAWLDGSYKKSHHPELLMSIRDFESLKLFILAADGVI